ncbi:MAG TPA: hypothetical protein VHM28_10340 [Anaerolineales bacterium]|jgi:hypothetical protein|nr:hypothetical protein [Anaerolineales bacterium]
MKQLLTLVLAFLLAGCGAIGPAQPTAVPPTAQVVIATVLVPVTVEAPTQPPPPPTQPAPQVIVVTATQAAGVPATGGGAPSGGTATATLPADAGGNLFTNLTRSGSFISLRCLPQDITFTVSTQNAAVVEVDLYYRFEDLTTQPTTFTDWKNVGKMNSDKHGNFTIDFQVTQINPDLRVADRAWIDYQFVGIAKSADAVGRSGKISQQIFYSKDCP